MFKVIHIKNFRRGLATNSSSTHSIIYRNEGEMFKDLNIFCTDYFGRCTDNIAATKEAKIKYIFHYVWWDKPTVLQLLAYYPEIRQYFPLVEEAWKARQEDSYDDERFGMYTRDRIAPVGNYPGEYVKGEALKSAFSIEYLRHIIESEELVIVGGSDEQDFYYDTVAGHQEAPLYEDIMYDAYYGRKENELIKNGNYYVAFGKGCEISHYEDESGLPDVPKHKYASAGRLRFMVEDGEPTPEFPELIDLRITNKCEHGCPFCFMDSNARDKHADFKQLTQLIYSIEKQTEFSIGGGNVLLYPDFQRLVARIHDKGHIVNVTINVKDCGTILTDKELFNTFMNYVDGIGVSVFNENDVETFKKFFYEFTDKNEKYPHALKYMAMHVVPEYIGFENANKIVKAAQEKYHNVLLLGYKNVGRGKNAQHKKFTDKEIKELFAGAYCLSVDTTFARTYKKAISETFETRYTLTENEGEFSMYIDGISMNAYKSSHETEKPYALVPYSWNKEPGDDTYTYKEAFAKIRQDCGFKAYKERKYWEDFKEEESHDTEGD